MNKLKFLIPGFVFGIILIKGEVISWFRIQEMFRFQAFKMYGTIGSAVVIGAISIWLIKKYNIKTISGEEIKIAPKQFSRGNVFGGLLFGFGWAMTGGCPGAFYALIGSGMLIVSVMFLSAVLGACVYSVVKDKLPH